MSVLTTDDLQRTRTNSSRLDTRKAACRQHVHHVVMRWIDEISRLSTDQEIDAFLAKIGRVP